MDAKLDDLPCGFLSFDDDSVVLQANETVRRWLGQDRDSIIGTPFERLLTPACAIFHQTHLFPLLKMRGEVGEIYMSMRTGPGEILPVLVNARRRVSQAQARNDCILVPMQERHRFERELMHARKAAEQARDAKARFLSTLAHEVRNPLSAITGMADVMSAGMHGPLNEDLCKDVDMILRAGLDIERLIEEVLRYSRAEAGRGDEPLEAVPLERVFDAVEAMTQLRWQQNGIEFRRLGEAADCVVRAHPMHLQQVLLNLLSNAAKFTPAGGRVSLECSHDETRSRVRIDVRDSGCGIPQDQLARIFEPFVQLHASPDRDRDTGAGLGLAICHELARTMKGTLQATSTVGEGSVFSLTLCAEPA